jgi:hypothetical protein
VIQDPLWEQSFPLLDSLVLPLSGVDGGTRPVRLRRGEAKDRRVRNEDRLARQLDELRTLGIEPILISSSATEDVFRAFLAWADERQFRQGRGL